MQKVNHYLQHVVAAVTVAAVVAAAVVAVVGAVDATEFAAVQYPKVSSQKDGASAK